MKLPKVSAKAKSVLKFEAKLLLAVAVLGLVTYFGALALIYHAGNDVANAYTQDFTK